MSAVTIIETVAVEGIELRMENGELKVLGDRATVERWLPIIRASKADILAQLARSPSNEPSLANLADLSPEGRAAGERIYRALLSPRQDHARECARNAQEEVRRNNREEGRQLTLPASTGTCQIDREAFQEGAAIREFDGRYSEEDAELLAAWEIVQAIFARLTPREWLPRYAPERLPEGDDPANCPIAQVQPGHVFRTERQRRMLVDR